MSILIPSKLSKSYRAPATPFRPVEGRKYTLIQKDTSGEMSLTIGCDYNLSDISSQTRDEVLAEWVPHLGEYSLIGRVYVSGGEFDENFSKVRYMIFQKELETALNAIVYGDKAFFQNFPWLQDSPIYIHFESVFPEFSQVQYFGTPRHYLKLEL